MFGSPTENWSEFMNWVTSLKFDGVIFDFDFPTDSLNIRNTNTNTVTRISRMVIESMEPSYRRQHIMSTIAQMMTTTGSVSTGAITITQGTYSINAGGGGGAGFGNTIRGAIGVPMYVDEYYERQKEQAEKEQLAKKLFSTNEHALFQSMKRHIWDTWQGKRVIEENQLWNRDRMVIAGGCFTSMITGDTLNDYDVFLLDDEHNRKIVDYMVSKYGDRDDVRVGGSNYMDNEKIEQTIFFNKSKFQYITTKYKTREELIEHFDFKHCRVSYDLMTEKLFIARETMDLILNKELDPSRPNDPPKQWRYEKFRERGWKERGYQDFVTI